MNPIALIYRSAPKIVEAILVTLCMYFLILPALDYFSIVDPIVKAVVISAGTVMLYSIIPIKGGVR